MKRSFKWLLGIVAILVGAWLIATLLTVVGEQKASRDDNLNQAQEIEDLNAAAAQLQLAMDEVNRRCLQAKDCVPVRVPEVPPVDDQEQEIQEREIQEVEIDDKDPDDPEIQQAEPDDAEIDNPEPDDPPVPGPPGADGVDGTNGTNGVDGKDGRGLTDAQCDPVTGRWVMTWSDGTTSDGGSCVVVREPSGDQP